MPCETCQINQDTQSANKSTLRTPGLWLWWPGMLAAIVNLRGFSNAAANIVDCRQSDGNHGLGYRQDTERRYHSHPKGFCLVPITPYSTIYIAAFPCSIRFSLIAL